MVWVILLIVVILLAYYLFVPTKKDMVVLSTGEVVPADTVIKVVEDRSINPYKSGEYIARISKDTALPTARMAFT